MIAISFAYLNGGFSVNCDGIVLQTDCRVSCPWHERMNCFSITPSDSNVVDLFIPSLYPALYTETKLTFALLIK